MNRKLNQSLARFFLLLFVFASDPSEAFSQKRDAVKPPAETASLAETQHWLIANFAKHASYKTRTNAVAVSDVKFDGCAFSFVQTRKSGSTSTAVMGATKTISTVADDVSFDTRLMAVDGIILNEHIYPELQIMELRFGSDSPREKTGSSDRERVIEIVVKREASEAIKSALSQVRRLCSEKN